MKIQFFTRSFRTLAAGWLMLSAQTGFTQESFNTCTGQNVLSISGATTSTVQNLTGSPVNIRITARGGDGGEGLFDFGGSGATMRGDFVLANNATLLAVSGAAGIIGFYGNGGGGSGAVNCGNPSNCANGTILIIAAGGGGSGDISGIGGSASTDGSGNGGPGSGNSGGGGGVNGNGGGSNYGGQVLKTGLSVNVGSGALGMGGGGGRVGSGPAGGGGGYTGGGANLGAPASSFNSGTSPNNTNGVNGGGNNMQGSVNVVCLSLVLPVELVDFKAAVSQGKVALHWQTASELDNLGYQVQRSPDARNWKDLGFVAGAGTTQQEQRYAFTDDGPLPGINYYRLRQTDFDGRSEYSPILIANLGFASKALTFFPNPAPEGLTSLYFPEAPEAEALLEVFDWLGNKVHRQTILLEGGSDVLVPLDLHSFPAGMYVATLEMGGQVFSEKLMLKQ